MAILTLWDSTGREVRRERAAEWDAIGSRVTPLDHADRVALWNEARVGYFVTVVEQGSTRRHVYRIDQRYRHGDLGPGVYGATTLLTPVPGNHPQFTRSGLGGLGGSLGGIAGLGTVGAFGGYDNTAWAEQGKNGPFDVLFMTFGQPTPRRIARTVTIQAAREHVRVASHDPRLGFSRDPSAEFWIRNRFGDVIGKFDHDWDGFFLHG